MAGCKDLVLHGYVKGVLYVGEDMRSVGMGFGGLLSRLGTSVRCHVARDKKRVRRKKQFFKFMFGEDVFVVAECYVVVFRDCCWDYEDVSNLGVVGDTSGLPWSGGHGGCCCCRHF